MQYELKVCSTDGGAPEVELEGVLHRLKNAEQRVS